MATYTGNAMTTITWTARVEGPPFPCGPLRTSKVTKGSKTHVTTKDDGSVGSQKSPNPPI